MILMKHNKIISDKMNILKLNLITGSASIGISFPSLPQDRLRRAKPQGSNSIKNKRSNVTISYRSVQILF